MTEPEQLEQRILDLVTRRQGMKKADLYREDGVLDFAFLEKTPRGLVGFVADMVKRGLLVEVEYATPRETYRMHGFLLPPNSFVHVEGPTRPNRPISLS